MNIACFPPCLPLAILGEILRGGAEKVKEAGALLVGGHTVEDNEPKYGLSVMGLIHPEKVISNAGACVGDVLIITKPLGIGILNTAIKGGLASQEAYQKNVDVMSYLNKDACHVMLNVGVSGCTDITGFGFLGHAAEMAEASRVTLEIYSESIPIIGESMEYAMMGIIPGGAYRNREYLKDKVIIKGQLNKGTEDILYDPQTSGGLLIALPEASSGIIMEELSRVNRTSYAIVGRVKKRSSYLIEVI